MKVRCFIYRISTKLKLNINPLTIYYYFDNPTPEMYIRTKRYVFFIVFLIDTCLMINFIPKIDIDGKH